jgi:tellurite resistance protein TerC
LKYLRKLIIAIVGGTVLLIGVALIVLPGPAFVVIPIGLAILATEFAWARRAVVRAKAMVGRKASQ